MKSNKKLSELKEIMVVGLPVEISLFQEGSERVFNSKVVEIKPNSMAYAQLSWFEELIPVNVRDEVKVTFLLDDLIYSYTSTVTNLIESGFIVKDAQLAELIGRRGNVRISTEIPATYRVTKSKEGFPVEKPQATFGLMLNISITGAGLLSAEALESPSILTISFTLPDTRHGLMVLEGKILQSRRISGQKKEWFYNDLIFVDVKVEHSQRLSEWIYSQLEKLSRTEFELKTLDRAAQAMLKKAKDEGLKTIWDRCSVMQPQCSFGELGICCRTCLQGPCRVDPFGEGATKGICGATKDVMIARNLVRMIAGGTAAHSEHGRHQAHVLQKVGADAIRDYSIKDEAKLKAVAARVGIAAGGLSPNDLARDIAAKAFEDFSREDEDTPCTWLSTTIPSSRLDRLKNLNLLPCNINGAIADAMHRTTSGVDLDPLNLLMGGIRCALADYVGMHIATDVSDILFGTPVPRVTQANLGVIEMEAVNIAVHGHNPILSEAICEAAHAWEKFAIQNGAGKGINIVGICCTGNEVLMRRGVPLAANLSSSELAIITGALDAIVVDYQCIMPSLGPLAGCYHTKLITTMDSAKMARDDNVLHIGFHPEKAIETAGKIIHEAIRAFKRRDPGRISIPQHKEKAIIGFSTEAIVNALSTLDPGDPLKPLVDNVINGNIKGICLLAGCNNVHIRQDYNIITIAKALLEKDVLIVTTGCNAVALAKAGLMTPEATRLHAGVGLKKVLISIGEAAGMKGPLPPVLHMGSCVDNTRAVDLAVAIANRMGADIDKLPIVASAPEPTQEKAVAIGTWAVALGIPVHLGIIPPIAASESVVEILTRTAKDIFGGYFLIELNPVVAAGKLMEAIEERRRGLGL